MKRKMIISGAAGAILIAAGATAFIYGSNTGVSAEAAQSAEAQQGPPPASVAVASAERRSLAPRSEAPGSVVSTRDSLVSAATTGKIEWVAEIGAEVEAGDRDCQN